MNQYLTKMTLTTQGWAAMIKSPQNRFEAVVPMFEAVGGKLLDYWFAIDQGAIYCHWEGPVSPSDVLAMVMAVLGGGTVASFEGTRLLTAAEAMEAMKKASSLGYRSPTSTTPTKK
jgi:uncharacterized protein with GYD domain